MKVAVQVKETLTRTVIVEADNRHAAERMVSAAYKDEKLVLTADSSIADVEIEDVTDTYIKNIGEKEFEVLEVSTELL